MEHIQLLLCGGELKGCGMGENFILTSSTVDLLEVRRLLKAFQLFMVCSFLRQQGFHVLNFLDVLNRTEVRRCRCILLSAKRHLSCHDALTFHDEETIGTFAILPLAEFLVRLEIGDYSMIAASGRDLRSLFSFTVFKDVFHLISISTLHTLAFVLTRNRHWSF